MFGIAAAHHESMRRARRPSAPGATASHPQETPPTAALRLFARRPGLAPADASNESFKTWLASLGVHIDDPDEFADTWITMCELNGWSIPANAVMAPDAVAEPSIVTPKVPDPPKVVVPSFAKPAQVAPSVVGPPAPAPPALALPTRANISESQAAEAFVAWLRKRGIRQATAKDLTSLYAKHCVELDLPEIAEMRLRFAMKTVAGVGKHLVDTPGKPRRYRPSMWTFAPNQETVSEETIPWVELPNRRVA